MNKTIGQLLDSRDEFFNWINSVSTALVALNAIVESGMLAGLGEEPATPEVLSAQTGIPADKLDRLLDFLVAHEIVEHLPDGRIARTPRVDAMEDAASSIQCVMIGSMAGGAQLYPALQQGKTPYELAHGKPVFAHLGANPELAAIFVDFMGFMTRRVEDFVFSQHEFEPFEVAMDVGGSHGGLLLSLLAHYPGTRGILFDLPEVAAQVADGVKAAPEGDRVEVVGGSFFEEVPQADLYLIKMILHDWDDAECVKILKTIRKAIPPGGRIAVIDYLLPEVPAPTEGLSLDLAMMIWDTGQERKLSEFEALFDASGFKLDRVSENPHGQSVIEAAPV